MSIVNAGSDRQRETYEYMVVSTSCFTIDPIDESYELHRVERVLTGGHINFILVFRRPWTEVTAAKKRNFPELFNEPQTQ